MRIFLLLLLVVSTHANAMSGLALVADLNARYGHEVTQCQNGTPAYYCSGVLLRAVDYNAFFKFWDYGSKATQLGSVAFTFIRSDVGSTTLNGGRKSGFILKDQASALAAGQALRLRCVFPFPTDSLDDRTDHGCGFVPKNWPPAPAQLQFIADLANCAKLAVPAITPALWLHNFREHQSLPKNQCSLSAIVAAEFHTSIVVHDLVDAVWTAKSMEILIETWDESKPVRLPLAAVFYETSAPAKLADAQKFQMQYYQATSLYVPIVRLNLAATDRKIFSFSAVDQVYGKAVADHLNARYANTASDCAGKSAYSCSGVLIRTTKGTPRYHAWDPSPTAIALNGVPFSYLRQDIPMQALYRSELEGFVFKSLNDAEKSAAYPVSVRCSFPFDGATNRRAQSCGHHDYFPQAGESCLLIGIDTLEKWKVHYNSHVNRQGEQCSLGPEKDQFSIFLKGRDHFDYPVDLNYPNEVVMAAWPVGIPKQLPIEAFIYVDSVTGLSGAQFMQSDYFEVTGDFMPVVRLSISHGFFSFSYYESEQVISTAGR